MISTEYKLNRVVLQVMTSNSVYKHSMYKHQTNHLPKAYKLYS